MCVACGSEPAPPDPAPAPTPTPEPAEPAEPEGPQPHVVEISFVVWSDDDQLTDCLDYRIRATPPDPIGDLEWPPTDIETTMAEGAERTGAERIQRTCALQFPNRGALASCTHNTVQDRETGVRIEMDATQHFYDLRVLEDDSDMRTCMREGGEWESVAADSPEAAAAHLRRAHQNSAALRERLNR